jgi:hypothetical protein
MATRHRYVMVIIIGGYPDVRSRSDGPALLGSAAVATIREQFTAE